MGIDPVTHKSFSHLMAEIATTLAPPQVAHLAEAALGCFKDEMLHLLTKKHIDFSSTSSAAIGGYMTQPPQPPISGDINQNVAYNREETIQKIKMGLSRAVLPEHCLDKGWGTMEMDGGEGDPDHSGLMCDMYTAALDYRYGNPSTYENDGEGSTWSTCTGGGAGGTAEGHGINLGRQKLKSEEDNREHLSESGKEENKEEAEVFGSDCVLWELTDDLMNHIV